MVEPMEEKMIKIIVIAVVGMFLLTTATTLSATGIQTASLVKNENAKNDKIDDHDLGRAKIHLSAASFGADTWIFIFSNIAPTDYYKVWFSVDFEPAYSRQRFVGDWHVTIIVGDTVIERDGDFDYTGDNNVPDDVYEEKTIYVRGFNVVYITCSIAFDEYRNGEYYDFHVASDTDHRSIWFPQDSNNSKDRVINLQLPEVETLGKELHHEFWTWYTATLKGRIVDMHGWDSCEVTIVWDTMHHDSWRGYPYCILGGWKKMYSEGPFSGDTSLITYGSYYYRAVAYVEGGGFSQGNERGFVFSFSNCDALFPLFPYLR